MPYDPRGTGLFPEPTPWNGDEPDEWEEYAPLHIFTCEACDGRGYTLHRVTVYEHGCGFSHYDTDERPCEHCGGYGEFIDDAEPDLEC